MEALRGSLLCVCLAAAILLGLQGCASSHAESSVVASVRAEDGEELAEAIPLQPLEAGRQTVHAESFPGLPPFQTLSRTASIESFPCSECHSEALKVLAARRTKNEPLSHWQVTMKHAPETVMSCQTCHGSGNMDSLQMISGRPASFDAPYDVCAQCHATQAKDWAGGAHGKRLGGWSGTRVVENCTGCHNPHTPAFASRWPAQLKRGMR